MNIDALVETHCHILPNIDDGSKSVEMSLEMIDSLKSQGAKAIVLTPHFYTNSISLEDFLAKRNASFNTLKNALPSDSPILLPSAEVYITDYIFNYENLDSLCMGNSRYMLVEHRMSCDFGKETYERLLNLDTEYNIKPVLAHIERYDPLMNDRSLLEDYIAMGCLVQVTISAFADAPKKIRKKLFKYLEKGLIHLVGSDCHNMNRRNPDYEQGANEIIKKYGIEPIQEFQQNANDLINNRL